MQGKNKKRALGIVALFILVISVLLIMTGCPWHTDSLYGLKVTGDGQGGAYAVYEDEIGGNIYMQKISPAGEKMWDGKGVLLVEHDSEFSNFHAIQVISDGFGSTIAAMPGTPSSIESESDYYVFKVDSQGQVDFLANKARITQMISDGSGGVILDYSPDEAILFVARIDSEGNFLWGREGISLPRQGSMWQITSDGNGGAIAVWKESQYPAWAEPGEARSTDSLFALKISADGELLWGDEQGKGMLVYDFPENVWIETLRVTGDGARGAIISWFQVTEDPSAEPGRQQTWEIKVQRIGDDGNILWQPGGISVDTSGAGPFGLPMEPSVLGDGSSGAIVVWREIGRIYAQRIDQDGNLLWQSGGVRISSTSTNPGLQVTGTGQGEIIVSYSFEEDRENLHVQKLGSNGETLWAENGVSILEGGFSNQFIAPDGQGGAIIAWGVNKGLFSSEKVYVQRVSADGQLVWGDDGIKLNP